MDSFKEWLQTRKKEVGITSDEGLEPFFGRERSSISRALKKGKGMTLIEVEALAAGLRVPPAIILQKLGVIPLHPEYGVLETEILGEVVELLVNRGVVSPLEPPKPTKRRAPGRERPSPPPQPR